MNLTRHEMPKARREAEASFSARLQSVGAARGLTAAKKSDAEGELRIYDVIGEDFWTGAGVTAPDIAAKLDALKGVSTLHIYINSPGGDLFTGKTVFNQIARFPADKIVHVDGIAASAASLIAMAGDKIITEEGGTWLVHEVAQWVVTSGRGTAEDHRKTANEIETETRAILGIYEKRTRVPADRLAALMREDRIIGAAEAKTYGLTDEISEVEQQRLDNQQAHAARASAPASPRSTADLARAQARNLRERFGGASPARNPGGPGNHTAAPATAGKGK